MRICDKCGSIQRPISGDGKPAPKMGTCLKCKKPVPRGTRYCSRCYAEMKIAEMGRGKGKRGRKAAIALIVLLMVISLFFGIFSALRLGNTGWLVIFFVSWGVYVTCVVVTLFYHQRISRRAGRETPEDNPSGGSTMDGTLLI